MLIHAKTLDPYRSSNCYEISLQLVPTALQIAIEENVEFRQGLPRDYLSYMGIAHSEEVSYPSYPE